MAKIEDTNKKWHLIEKQLVNFKKVLKEQDYRVMKNLYEALYIRSIAILKNKNKTWFSYTEMLSFVNEFANALILHKIETVIKNG